VAIRRQLRLILVAVALLLPGLACGQTAVDWWVQDESQAEQLEQALELLWANHGVSVHVAPPPQDATGVFCRDSELVLRLPGVERSAPCPADASTGVALVRSWMLATAPPPSPPASEVLALDPAVAAPTLHRGGARDLWLVGSLGPASRRPDKVPALRLSAEADMRLDPVLLGLAAVWEPGEVSSLTPEAGSGAASITRMGVELSLGWLLDTSQGTLWVLGAHGGPRWIRGRSKLDPSAGAASWNTFSGGLRAHALRPVTSSVVMGGGVVLAMDWPPPPAEQQLPGGERPVLRPATLALELRVAGIRSATRTP
jgi:hypothetical protein